MSAFAIELRLIKFTRTDCCELWLSEISTATHLTKWPRRFDKSATCRCKVIDRHNSRIMMQAVDYETARYFFARHALQSVICACWAVKIYSRQRIHERSNIFNRDKLLVMTPVTYLPSMLNMRFIVSRFFTFASNSILQVYHSIY